MPLAVPLIIGGATALLKTGMGLMQTNSAEKDAASNNRAGFTIPREWYDNDNLAGTMAEHGLTEPSMNYYNQQAGRGLSAGLGTILQGGGSVNNIDQLYDTYNTGQQKIAEEDAQLKNQNIMNFINAHASLGNEKEKQWTLNEYEPWKDRALADAQKEKAGQQNTFGGLTDLANTAASFAAKGNYGDKPAAKADLAPAGPDQNAINASFNSADDSVKGSGLFGTPAGTDVLKQMSANNPNSPYIQAVLKNLNAGGYAPWQ